MEENLENEEELMYDFPPYEIDELNEENILGDELINYLVSLSNSAKKIRKLEEIRDKARELKKLRAFNSIYKQAEEKKEQEQRLEQFQTERIIVFPDMNNIAYNTNRYELDDNGIIYEVVPNLGRILVCYHPILPVETFTNLEDNSVKIKLGYYKKNKWNYITVDQSMISSVPSIVKLSDVGIQVNSENAKYMIRYLAEIQNLNGDKIPNSESVSRLGWFDGELMPYSKKFEFDGAKDMPNWEEIFGEKGKLEDWEDFFRERRKYNPISRIVMATSVVGILLNKLKQSGFTLHIFGESEFGKTVTCMVGESIFGNPAQSSLGIGINFNFTINGLESVLNRYNNIPLFINEMQHQKDAKDYDKILFMISEGKGKSRSNKTNGVARQNCWNTVAITNGEKNIIKDNSNAGAYNRCYSYEIKNYSYENLPEVADFVKENYGTPIREILANLENFDIKEIYEEQLKTLEDEDTSNKQKILQALILTGDRIVTDILFKDNFYLTKEDLLPNVVKKSEIVIDERALETIQDWYISEKRHFLDVKEENFNNSENELKVEIYGRKMEYDEVAFIPTILKRKLNDFGFDGNEIINAWKRKGYLICDKKKNTKKVRINGEALNCVVLRFKADENDDDSDFSLDDDTLPF